MKLICSSGNTRWGIVALVVPFVLIGICASYWYGRQELAIEVYDPLLWRELENGGYKKGVRVITGQITEKQSLLGRSTVLAEVELPPDTSAGSVICRALADALGQASPAVRTRFQRDRFANEIYDKLDVNSFRSSLRPGGINRLSELTDRFRSNVSTNGCRLVIEQEDWYYEFDVVASADFDHDGWEDLLVVFRDRAIGTSYNSTQPLLLVQNNRNNIVAQDVSVDRAIQSFSKK